MDCPQNNVLTALLLADPNTRSIVMPLVENTNKWNLLSDIDDKTKAMALFAKNKLEATVYGILINGDKSNIYKPLLVDKFGQGFRARGNFSQLELQELISDIENGQIAGRDIETTIGALKDMGILNAEDIKNASDVLQNKLILDYVTDGKKDFSVNGTKVSRKQYVEHHLKEGTLPKRVTQDPIYQTLRALDSGANEESIAKDYLRYKSVFDGRTKRIDDIDAVATEIPEGPLKDVISQTNDIDWLSEILVTNIKDSDIVEQVKTRIGQLDKTENFAERLIMLYAEKANPSTEDVVAVMQLKLEEKLKYLNNLYGTSIPIDSFVEWLNTVPNKTKTLDDINKAINSKMKSWKNKYMSNGVTKEEEEVLKGIKNFFRNYDKSFIDTNGLGVFNSFVRGENKIGDVGEVVFLNIETEYSSVGKKIGQAFTDSKLAYRIEGPEVPVVTLKNLDSYLDENKDVVQVIVQSRTQGESEQVIKAIQEYSGKEGGRTISIVMPSDNGNIFDVYKNNLVVGSSNYGQISRARNKGLKNGYYAPIIDESEKLGKALDDYIKVLYPDIESEQLNIMKSMLPSNASPTDLENMLKLASEADRNSQYRFMDIEEYRKNITDADIESYAQSLGYKGDISIDDNLRDWYLKATVAPQGPNANREIAEGMRGFLTQINALDLMPEPRDLDFVGSILHGAFLDGNSTIIRRNGLEEMVSMIRNRAGTDTLASNSWFNAYVTINDLNADDALESIKRYMKSYNQKINTNIDKSGFGLYLVKDYSRYGELYSDLDIEDISSIKAKDYNKSVDKINKNIRNAIEEYREEVIKDVNSIDQVPYERARSRKQKLVNSLLENENLLREYGALGTETYTYGARSIYTKDDITQFNVDMDDLISKYGTDINKAKESVSKKPIDSLVKGEKAIVANGSENPIVITPDKLLEYERKMIVDGGYKISIPNTKGYTEAQKADVAVALRTAREQMVLKMGAQTAIYNHFSPGLGRFINNYLNINFDLNGTVYNIPRALVDRNNISSFGFSDDVDYGIKTDILKEITDIIKLKRLDPIELESVIDKVLSINGITENLAEISRLYMDDFFGYTMLAKLDSDIIKNGLKLIPSPKLTPEQSIIYSNLMFEDIDGIAKPVSSFGGKADSQFPDILYKKDKSDILTTLDVNTGIEVDKQAVQRNVLLTIDDMANGMTKNANIDDFMIHTARNSASQVLDTSPRLRNTKDISSLSINSGLIASEVFRPAFVTGKAAGNTAKSWFYKGYTKYDPVYINNLINDTKVLMDISEESFRTMDVNRVNQNAYNLANHLRLLKKNFANITVDKAFNDSLVKDVDSLLDDIVEIGSDGIPVLKQGTKNELGRLSGLVGAYKLEGLESAFKQGAIFYGLKSFQDAGIRYKKKSGRLFGFGNEFFDEGLSEFNRLFNSNLNINQYRTVTGALIGDVVEHPLTMLPRLINNYWNVANSPFMRFLTSVPGSILTGVPTAGGYLNTLDQMRKINESRDGWDGISAFRQRLGILNSSSVDAEAVFNKVTVEGGNPIESVVDIAYTRGMFNAQAAKEFIGQGFDNGQNFVDGLYATSIKNESLISAIKSEGFFSLDDFEKGFLLNESIDRGTKQAVYNKIVGKAYDMHEGLINYTGRAISRNIDTGSIGSRIAGVTSFMLNPINFRAGLGNNMLLNIASNVSTLFQYAYRYRNFDDVVNAVGRNPNLIRFLEMAVYDTAMALKLANLNDYGELSEEREFTVGDMIAALEVLSQPFQFTQMSAAMRVMSSALFSENEFTYQLLKEYSRNAFRQLKTSRGILEMSRIAATGDMDNFAAYWTKFWTETSTSAMRYTLQDGNVVMESDGGIPTVFGGSSKYQDFFYSNTIGNEEWKQLREGKFTDWRLGAKVLKDIMMGSQVSQSVQVGTQIGTEVIGIFNREVGQGLAEALGVDYKRSYLDPAEVATQFKKSYWASKYVDGKYQFNRIPIEMLGEEFDIYQKETETIARKMKLDFVAGSEDFADIIDSYRKKGHTEFTKDNGYTMYNNESLTQLFDEMSKDGSLDAVYDQIRTATNKKQTQAQITNHLINYISSMKNKPMNFDQLQHQLANALIFENQVLDASKGSTKMINDAKRVDLTGRFIERYWDEYQNTMSDGKYSEVGVEAAMDMFALDNPEISKTFFKLDKNGNPKSIQPKYKSYILDTYEFESALENGVSPRTGIQGIRGPYSLFAASATGEDKKRYNTQANIEGVLHGTRFIDSLGHLPQEEKEILKINLLTNMPTYSLDIKDIEAEMGPEVAENYRRQINQSYQYAVNTQFAVLDAMRSKGGGSESYKGINIGELGNFIKQTKEYINRNSADMYKPMTIKKSEFNVYRMSGRSRGEQLLRPPEMPSYSAKSKSLLPKPKTKAPTQQKPKKVKKASLKSTKK